MLRFLTTTVIFLSFTSGFLAAQEPMPLSFKAWKEQQMIEARNQVVRLSNKMTLSKAGQGLPEAGSSAATSTDANVLARVQKDPHGKAEGDLKRSLDNLQSAKELTLEDYFVVYLSRFRGQPDALEYLTQKMSKEEMAELLRVMLNRSQQLESSAVKPSLGGLVAGDRHHNL